MHVCAVSPGFVGGDVNPGLGREHEARGDGVWWA